MKVAITVDGAQQSGEIEPRLLLVEWLRSIGKTGTHIGCDTSSCGACTVLVDGAPAKSCTLLTVQVDGSSIETIQISAGGTGSLIHDGSLQYEVNPTANGAEIITSTNLDQGSLRTISPTISAYVDGRLERLYGDYTGMVVNQGDHP